MTIWPADKVQRRPIGEIIPFASNARVHSDEQIAQIAASMREWGWTNPVLIDEAGTIIAGHGRILAARQLGLETVPVMVAEGWSEAKKRAYVLADNQLALNAGWDLEILSNELRGLKEWDFDLSLLGFENLDELMAETTEGLTDPDAVPEAPVDPISRPGDVWTLGRHRLICGDCTDPKILDRALEDRKADLCLTDPPYGLETKKASGKNDYQGYADTLDNLRVLAAAWLPMAREKAVAVVFSPGVTRQWVYPEPDWVICWFYGGGQLRSPWGFNCWQPFLCFGKDPSLASGRGARPDAVDLNVPANRGDLDHPCPKPVRLWQWLIDRLVFSPNSVVLDPFCGSGTTLIAAEMRGISCAAVELVPSYCDVAVIRWQEFTGKAARLEGGSTFKAVKAQRRGKLAA